jgi:hypothetical protein
MRQQAIKPPLLFIFVLIVLTPSISAFAQDKESAAEKKKAEAASLEITNLPKKKDPEIEKRKAALGDLINAYNQWLAADEELLRIDTIREREPATRRATQRYETFLAKLDKTPLDVLTPFSSVGKSANLRDTKKAAFLRLYEAYEYGIENPKSASAERKP